MTLLGYEKLCQKEQNVFIKEDSWTGPNESRKHIESGREILKAHVTDKYGTVAVRKGTVASVSVFNMND